MKSHEKSKTSRRNVDEKPTKSRRKVDEKSWKVEVKSKKSRRKDNEKSKKSESKVEEDRRTVKEKPKYKPKQSRGKVLEKSTNRQRNVDAKSMKSQWEVGENAQQTSAAEATSSEHRHHQSRHDICPRTQLKDATQQ